MKFQKTHNQLNLVDRFFNWFEKKVPKYFQFFITITIICVFMSAFVIIRDNHSFLPLRITTTFQAISFFYGVVSWIILLDFIFNLRRETKPKHFYVVWAICIIISLPRYIGNFGYNSTKIGSIFEVWDYTENYVTYISFEHPDNPERKIYIQPAVISREGGSKYYYIEEIQMRDGSYLYFDSSYVYPFVEKHMTDIDGAECYVTLTNLQYPYDLQ